MQPPVFDLLNVSAVTSIVGTNPVRVFGGSVSTQEPPAYPYVTWQTVAAIPAATFDLPGFDNWRVQVDCWSQDIRQVRTLAEAVRDAMENDGENALLSVNDDSRDPDTKAYRFSMDFSIWVRRD